MTASLARLAGRLYAADLLTSAFAFGLAILAVAASSRLPDWVHVAATAAAIALLVPTLVTYRARRDSPFLRFLHDWSLAGLVYLVYRELYLVTGPLHGGRTRDAWLIVADRWLCGGDPTVWLADFAHPLLTEILQIGYTTFYVLILSTGAELWRRRADGRFRVYTFACGYTFYLSYIGYLLVPAIGPRGTLHDFEFIGQELPGLWLTRALRAFVNGGGLAPTDVPNDVFLASAHRDVFPSGHAAVTLLVLYWAWRQRLAVRWWVTVPGVLLLVSTVYLRYHYVIDVVAGAALAAFCILTTPAVHGWVARTFGTIEAARNGVETGGARTGSAPTHPAG